MKPRLIVALLLAVALPANATSIKDWLKKSDAEQVGYLGYCVTALIVEVARTDHPLALEIKNWYGDKPPGHEYTDGTTALLTRILQLEKRAETDKSVDLSKIEVEDVVYSVTAEKFKLPPRQAPDTSKDSSAKPFSTRKKNPEQPTAPYPAPNAANLIMVGKIDVSHFAGVKRGDTPQQVVAIYGQPTEDHGTYQFWGNSSGFFMVSYVDNAVTTLELYSNQLGFVRAHGTNDALVDLIGQKEPAVVALLGPPTDQEEEDAETYNLYWAFPMAGHPAPANANRASEQTLRLRFKRINPPRRVHGVRQDDADCIWVSVTW
ncbi:MAG: hypothetical protein WCC21_02245 [Candidatus Acidiferrales bacterium]